jgi:hypothetical protein
MQLGQLNYSWSNIYVNQVVGNGLLRLSANPSTSNFTLFPTQVNLNTSMLPVPRNAINLGASDYHFSNIYVNDINPDGSNVSIGGAGGMTVTPTGSLAALWNNSQFYPSTTNQGSLGYSGGIWSNIYVNQINPLFVSGSNYNSLNNGLYTMGNLIPAISNRFNLGEAGGVWANINVFNVNADRIFDLPLVYTVPVNQYDIPVAGSLAYFDLPTPAFPGTIEEVQLRCGTATPGPTSDFYFGSNVAGNQVGYGYYSYVFRNTNPVGRDNLNVHIRRGGTAPIGKSDDPINVQLSPGEKVYMILLININTLLDYIFFGETAA